MALNSLLSSVQVREGGVCGRVVKSSECIVSASLSHLSLPVSPASSCQTVGSGLPARQPGVWLQGKAAFCFSFFRPVHTIAASKMWLTNQRTSSPTTAGHLSGSYSLVAWLTWPPLAVWTCPLCTPARPRWVPLCSSPHRDSFLNTF